MSELLLSFFDEGKLDASVWEECDDWFLAFSNDEHVVDSGGEVLSSGVLNVGNIEGAGVLLDVLQDAASANIVSSNGQN